MDQLRIAFIQTQLIWENSEANLLQFNKFFEKIEQADLVVLPEMFNSGFTQSVVKMAQPMSGPAINWMKAKSLEMNSAIIGSLIVAENDLFYNRLVMTKPCSGINWYDKRHLFRMGGEHENFTQGKQKVVFDYLGWRIRPLVCYDLRFPVWSRNQDNYDLLIYVANWPASRREVWLTLLKARAIENQCYVLGVNRVGTDGMGINYLGESMVIDAKGNILKTLPLNEEGIGEVTISLGELQSFRNKFPVSLDADTFNITGLEP